jgi:hypothetical protein
MALLETVMHRHGQRLSMQSVPTVPGDSGDSGDSGDPVIGVRCGNI